MRLYEIRLTNRAGEVRVIPNVVEYVGGFEYFFCAIAGSREAFSFPRRDLALVERRLPGQPWLRVVLKRAPPQEAEDAPSRARSRVATRASASSRAS